MTTVGYIFIYFGGRFVNHHISSKFALILDRDLGMYSIASSNVVHIFSIQPIAESIIMERVKSFLFCKGESR